MDYSRATFDLVLGVLILNMNHRATMKSGRGGKREGAGAPAGERLKPEEKAKRVNTTMAPDLVEYLDMMKKRGHSKASVFDKALRMYRANFDKFPEWKSVKEKVPKIGVRVLTLGGAEWPEILHRDIYSNKWVDDAGEWQTGITHWMELPPKG